MVIAVVKTPNAKSTAGFLNWLNAQTDKRPMDITAAKTRLLAWSAKKQTT